MAPWLSSASGSATAMVKSHQGDEHAPPYVPYGRSHEIPKWCRGARSSLGRLAA